MRNLSIIVAAFLFVGAGASYAADLAAGETVAKEQCAACHGADGNSTNPQWPKLAGQHAGFTKQQVAMFKSGERHNDLMSPVAKGLSDADLDNVAAFYATQSATIGKVEPEAVEIAQNIYRGGLAEAGVVACAACHGPTGSGNPGANFPSLSGQHAAYAETRLLAYKQRGKADNADPADMMGVIASKLTDEQIKALAAYISALSGE